MKSLFCQYQTHSWSETATRQSVHNIQIYSGDTKVIIPHLTLCYSRYLYSCSCTVVSSTISTIQSNSFYSAHCILPSSGSHPRKSYKMFYDSDTIDNVGAFDKLCEYRSGFTQIYIEMLPLCSLGPESRPTILYNWWAPSDCKIRLDCSPLKLEKELEIRLNENKRSLHFKNLKTELKNHFAWEVLFKDKAWTLYGIECQFLCIINVLYDHL